MYVRISCHFLAVEEAANGLQGVESALCDLYANDECAASVCQATGLFSLLLLLLLFLGGTGLCAHAHVGSESV